MPLPVRSKSLRAGTREDAPPPPQLSASRNASRNTSPTKLAPPQPAGPLKSTDERIEAARQRRLSIASQEAGKRNSLLQERKPSGPPPTSFKAPAQPVRSTSASRARENARRESISSSKDTGAPQRAPSTSRGRQSLDEQRPSPRRSSASSRRSDATTVSTHARHASVDRPPAVKSSNLRRPSPTKALPTRTASARTPSTRRPTPATPSATPEELQRPSFSTNQQQFTPAKRLPRHPSSPQKPAQAPTIRTSQTLKAQAHLLQMVLLSEEFDTTYAAWTESAYRKLEAKFAALQQMYASSLRTARTTRQSRNLLALWMWSGGNDASLVRKLGALSNVLSELSDLTRGDDAWVGCEEARSQGWWVEHQGEDVEGLGEYTRTVRAFEAWVNWVETVWAARDQIRGVGDDGEASPPVTPARRRQAPANNTNGALEEVQMTADTQLQGLGDDVKTSVRSMAATLDRLSIRLEELRNPEIPIPLPPEPGAEGIEEPGVGPIPTPWKLVDTAWTLVQGLREELQIMREVEFEVTIGEKAWIEQRVKAIGENVAGGFGTPMGLR